MTGDENLRLIREIEANRAFLLQAYQQNPTLAARAEPRIRALLLPLPEALIKRRRQLAGSAIDPRQKPLSDV